MAIIVSILLFLIAFAIIANMGDMITAVIIMLAILAIPVLFYAVVYLIVIFEMIFGKKK
jgi:hypothetical protein